MAATVILSPHLDDAVFSCWHAVDGRQVTVLTVFAGLPPAGTTRLWDRVCGQADSRRMVQARRDENKAALRHTSAAAKHLEFLDAQYRHSPPSIDELVNEILANSPAAATFMVPLAASRVWRHPDHVLVRQAGLALMRLGHPIVLYPDLPYMASPHEPTPAYLQKLCRRTASLLGVAAAARVHRFSASQQRAKRAAMKAYRSQYRQTNITSLGGLSRIARRGYEIYLIPD
jgi:LmbE family N-acetylglucosaminyl deacetylase